MVHAASTQDLWGEILATFLEYVGNYQNDRAVSRVIFLDGDKYFAEGQIFINFKTLDVTLSFCESRSLQT
jgi:hypothetical protein